MPSAFSRRQFLATATAVGLVDSPTAASDVPCASQSEADGVVWRRTYGDDGAGQVTDAVADGDGYALVGIDRDAETNGRSWLRRVDGDGREQWCQEYGDDERRAVTSVAVTADDGYLLAGTVGRSDDAQFVTKTDADGGERWTTTVSVPGRDVFVAERFDETIVLGASVGDPDLVFPHLTVLDADGEISRSQTFDEYDGWRIRSGLITDDTVVLAGTENSDDVEGLLWRVAVDEGIEIERSTVFERRVVAADGVEGGGLVLAGTNGPWLARLDQDWEVEWERTEFEPSPHIEDVSTVPGGVAACGYHWGAGCARPPWAFRANDDGTTWYASADDSPRLEWESVLPANEGDRVVVAGTDYDGPGSSAVLALVEEPESDDEENTARESDKTTATAERTTTDGDGRTTDGTTDGTATPGDDSGTPAGESSADGLDGFGLGAAVATLTATLGYRVRRNGTDD